MTSLQNENPWWCVNLICADGKTYFGEFAVVLAKDILPCVDWVLKESLCVVT